MVRLTDRPDMTLDIYCGRKNATMQCFSEPALVCSKNNLLQLLYFFVYKTDFFHFQNKSKSLDLPYKMDQDLWDC